MLHLARASRSLKSLRWSDCSVDIQLLDAEDQGIAAGLLKTERDCLLAIVVACHADAPALATPRKRTHHSCPFVAAQSSHSSFLAASILPDTPAHQLARDKHPDLLHIFAFRVCTSIQNNRGNPALDPVTFFGASTARHCLVASG